MSRPDALWLIGCLLTALLAIMLVPGCRRGDPVALPPVPAQVEADRLGRLAEDDRLAAAGAQAQADVLDRQAIAATSAAERARLQADADAARLRDGGAQARADAAADLRRDAEARATAERAELQALAAQAALDAETVAARKAEARDRRLAVWSTGACVAAAAILLLLRVPPLYAIGIPSAAAAGLLFVVGWSSVPWLGWALGLSILGVLAIGLAAVVAWIVRHWQRHADDVQALGRAEADERSIAAQPVWLRPLITRLLRT